MTLSADTLSHMRSLPGFYSVSERLNEMDCTVQVRELIDEVVALRAEVAALREAGRGMYAILTRRTLHGIEYEAVRRWREASSGAGATKSSQTTEASPPAPDDVGPPAPGEGEPEDGYSNPEVGMTC